MKRFIGSSLSVVIALGLFAFSKTRLSARSECDGYYYWFRIQSSTFVNCHGSDYFLEYPLDWNGNAFPDYGEVVQGDDIQAQFDFGCDDYGDFCCAVGYNYRDIELTWDGRWRPKVFAVPQCVVHRNY